MRLFWRDTVYTVLHWKFPYTSQTGDQYTLKIAENVFIDWSGPTMSCVNCEYWQLWLYAMQHYQEMSTDAKKKKKDLLTKAEAQRADKNVLSAFAALVNQLGFEFDEIHWLKQQFSNRKIVHHTLLKAWKPDYYKYNDTTLEVNVT